MGTEGKPKRSWPQLSFSIAWSPCFQTSSSPEGVVVVPTGSLRTAMGKNRRDRAGDKGTGCRGDVSSVHSIRQGQACKLNDLPRQVEV